MSSKPATFDGAPPPGHINFGVGQPSADALPLDLIRQASEHFLADAQPLELNYGVREGDERFRDALAMFLSRHYDSPARADSLLLTAGNSHALDFICTTFTRPGDTVFVEEPSYFLAFQVFRDHGLNIVGIPVDDNGMRMDLLEAELARTTPALIYTIPSFLNPGGQSLSAERRRRLVQLSEQQGFLIVADEVYQLLSYYGPAPVALGSLVEQQASAQLENADGPGSHQGSILSLGSFSKILAPGLRLGWIQAPPDLMARMLDNGSLNSGGSFNHYASHLVRQVLETGMQDAHLEHLRELYRRRVEAMDQALQHHLADLARWQKPLGGYFFWLQLQQDTDSEALRQQAEAFRTGFQPGPKFSSTGAFKHCLRLSFAHYNEDDISEGVERLAALLQA